MRSLGVKAHTSSHLPLATQPASVALTQHNVRRVVPLFRQDQAYRRRNKYIENACTSDRAAFPLTTRTTSSEKTLVGRQCLACYFLKNLHSSAKISRTDRVIVRIFEIFYLELRDPDILSAASSILRPLNIECSGFDPIFLRFCTLLRHIYARIRTYYLP